MIKRFLSRAWRRAKKTLRRWAKILKNEYGLMIAEIAKEAPALIDEANSIGFSSGSEKREFVAGRLVAMFTKHTLIAAGKIAVEELRTLTHHAIEMELTARMIEAKKKKKKKK